MNYGAQVTVYPPPALAHGRSDEDIQLWTMVSPSDLKKSKSIIGGEQFEAGPYDVVYFARMMAKIAHGIFEAEYRDEFPGFSPILNDFILHSTGNMLDFVGCDRNWPILLKKSKIERRRKSRECRI